MVVEALSLQHLGQLPPPSLRLLQLGSLVLKPDLDVTLLKPQLPRQPASPLLCQVSVGVKFSSQSDEEMSI